MTTRAQGKQLKELRDQEKNYKATALRHTSPSALREWADAMERRDKFERDLFLEARRAEGLCTYCASPAVAGYSDCEPKCEQCWTDGALSAGPGHGPA